MENKNSKTELIPKTDSANEAILINNIFISKSNDKQSFLIYHTLIAKGIASLMLLYHHLLREGNKFNKDFYNELIFFNINFRKYIAIFFKITTCSYTFLSGIGLYYSLIKLKNIKEMYKKCMKNFFRLMVIFWIILIFVYPKGLKTGLFNLKYSTIISCIFGIYGRKGNWWYIRMHFALLIYAPLIINLFKDINYKNKLIPIIIFYFIYFIIKIFRTSVTFNSMFDKIFFDYFFYFSYIDIILSFISGIVAAKYNIMLVYNNPNYESFYYCLFSIFSSIYIRCNLINYYLDILSWPKYSTLCYIWLIILTLISSYIINIVQIPIINFLNSKGFNYKGYFHFIKN